jgi:RHS repeat-associated protein
MVYYSVADPNWNVVALTNNSSVIQEHYIYSSFGKLNVFDASFTPKSASTCNLPRSFTGQVLDNEIGLMLYRNRVYHPTLGRFIQRDTIGYDGEDVNLMRYVANYPVEITDSFGLWMTGDTIPGITFDDPDELDMEPGDDIGKDNNWGQTNCPSGYLKERIKHSSSIRWRDVKSIKKAIMGYYDGFLGDTAYLYKGKFTLQRSIVRKKATYQCKKIEFRVNPQSCSIEQIIKYGTKFYEQDESWKGICVTFTGEKYPGSFTSDPGDAVTVTGLIMNVAGGASSLLGTL